MKTLQTEWNNFISNVVNWKICLIVLSCFLTTTGWGQTTLGAGDVAIVAINSANPDNFSFVLLKNITTNTVINFTDNGFTASTTTRVGEGFLTYTAPTNLNAGTVISWQNGMTITGTGWSSNNPSNFAFNGSGDQLFVFQGSTGNWGTLSGITLLYGLNYGTALSGTSGAGNTVQPSTAILPSTSFLNLGSSTYANTYFANGNTSATSVNVCGSATTLMTYFVDNTKWFGNSSNAATVPTYSISLTCPSSITGAATTAAFTTTYGTVSSTQSFTVSGSGLTVDITATAPTGFEVSSDNTSFSSTATFAQSGGTASGTLYIRLAATASVTGSYNAQNIVLSSTGATSVNITTSASGNIVSAKALTITGLSAADKNFDGNTTVNVSGTPQYSGLENGESFSVSGTVTWAFADALVGSNKTLSQTGTYNVPSSNYTLTQPSLSASIFAVVPAAPSINSISPGDQQLSVDFSAPSFNGGASISNYEYSTNNGSTWVTPGSPVTVSPLLITGLTNGVPYDVKFRAVNSVGSGIESNAVQGTPVASVNPVINISPSLFGAAFTTTYGAVSSNQQFTVSGAALSGDLTVSAPGGFEISFTPSSGFVSSLNLTQLSGNVTSTVIYIRLMATAAAGTYNSLSVSVSGGGATSLSVTTTSSGNQVGQKNLTITGLTASARDYDGTTDVTIVGTPSYAGLENGETFSVTGSVTWAFADKNAGMNKSIVQNGSYNAPSANYTVTQPSSLSANINPLSITLSGAQAQDKVYNRTAAATISGTLSGVINPDVVTFSGNGTFSSVNAGNSIPVTASITLGSADAANYSITQPTGLSANITPKPVTVGGIIVYSRPFNTTTSATVYGNPTAFISGSISADTANPAAVTLTGTGVANFANAGPGNNIQINISGYSLTGTAAGNYVLSQPALSANITPPVIALWNYNSISGTVAPSSYNADQGSGVCSRVGTMTVGVGATGMHPEINAGCGGQNGSNPGAWAFSSAAPGAANETNGIQYLCSTAGFDNIIFTWDQRSSNTAVNTIRLQYTLNGTSWTNFTMTSANTTFCSGSINANGCFENSATGDLYRRIAVDLSSITGANNNPNFGIRLLAAHYQITGAFRQTATPATAATAGTWRFDNVALQGSYGNYVSPVNLSVSSNSASETAATSITVTATRSLISSNAETVDLLVSGTGITASDYTLSNTTISIPANANTGSVTFTIVNDMDVEGTETAVLTLSNPSPGLSLGSTISQNIVIADDDNTPPTIAMNVASTSNFIDGGVASSPASPYAFSGVISDPTDPASTLGIDFTIADAETAVGSLTVTVSSSNTTVVPLANAVISGSGANRNLKITPAAVGYSNISVNVNDGINTTTYVIAYAASASAVNTATTRFHLGRSDASTSVMIDNDYMLVADDENQALRLYDRNNSGLSINSFDFTTSLGLTDISGGIPREVDIESSVKSGNRIYWLGSHNNSSSGSNRPNRSRIFATDIIGSGASTTLSYVGRFDDLKTQMIAWDQTNAHGLGAAYFGLAASTATGILPEAADGSGFNIEGLTLGPDNTTGYISFRAPISPATNRTKALIVTVSNFTTLFTSNPTVATATFGAPILLDLGGRGIREIKKNASNQYLIIAGPVNAATDVAPSNFVLYSWTGNANDNPVALTTAISSSDLKGSFEGIVDIANLMQNGDEVQLVIDNGDNDYYGDAIAAKDLPNANHKKASSLKVTLAGLVTPPVINSSLTASVAAGAVFSYTITATNTPTAFNATSLPASLSVNTSNGDITGNVASPDVYNINISASNAAGADNKVLVLSVTTTYYADSDGDNYGNPSSSISSTSATPPSGYVANNQDCDDNNAALNPTTSWYLDADNDNYYTGIATVQCASPGVGYKYTGFVAGGDCNDAVAAINPAATEICNSIDDDCDGTTDDGVTLTFYRDMDGDSYGNASVTATGCYPAFGYVLDNSDCNDAASAVNPGATEVCNGIDDDCDGDVDANDSDIPVQNWYSDVDGDGFGDASGSATISGCPVAGKVNNNNDCDDGVATVNPAATEICDNIDNDCDGLTDEGVTLTFYADADGDTYGNATVTATGCYPAFGYVLDNSDCNDAASAVNPGATEVCNGIDDDCDGDVDANDSDIPVQNWYSDVDGDGFGDASGTATISGCPVAGKVNNNTDCDDGVATVNPAATEICDNIDNDCDGLIDEGVTLTFYADADGDTYGNAAVTATSCYPAFGYVLDNSDCNDAASAVNPGATEVCNGIDDDCDGDVDANDSDVPVKSWYSDVDGDGFGDASGTATISGCPVAGKVNNNTDCDDGVATVNPAATEICDNIDNDCDGLIDEGVTLTFYADADGDTYGNAAVTATSCYPAFGYVLDNSDCNDAASAVNPGATEVCNGIDDDCDGDVDANDSDVPVKSWYSDVDGDGVGDAFGTATISGCPVAGMVNNNSDCDDGAATVNPAASEVCNLIDDDCDGLTDEGVQSTFYRDVDGDGYGNVASTTQGCYAPTGYVSNSTDCNDANAAVNPAATEVCNTIDDDCDGLTDEGVTLAFYADTDGDTYGNAAVTISSCSMPIGYVANNQDCNDNIAAINPTTSWYLDADNDNYYIGSATVQCASPGVGYKYTGLVAGGDCNDAVGAINPGASEICANSIDDDCDGLIDEGCNNFTYYRDLDNDTYGNASVFITSSNPIPPTGYVSNSTDCNDNNAGINPGAAEICNSIDDDCDGLTDEGLTQITASITATGGQFSFCPGTSVVINAVPAAPGSTFLWSNGATTPSISVNSPGSFSVTITNASGCTSIAPTVNVIKRYRTSDFNQDGITDVVDFLSMLAVFNQSCTACPQDISNDGVVNVVDYLSFLSEFGLSCQ